MTPIEDREFGELIEAVKNATEDIGTLSKKFDGYLNKHNDVHVAIAGQLSIIRFIGAILLLAIGAALTKLFGA